jgi:predicted nucleic acid-binding protein
LEGRQLLTAASAYSEALVAFARADRLDEAREALGSMGITVAPLTATMAELAAELRARHERLRLPEAIVLACARVSGGGLLSYDRRLAVLADGGSAEA